MTSEGPLGWSRCHSWTWRATEGGKSAKQGKTIEDKGKGKAEEGQDTYGEGHWGAVVGAEAMERASVGMASSWASAQSAETRGISSRGGERTGVDAEEGEEGQDDAEEGEGGQDDTASAEKPA